MVEERIFNTVKRAVMAGIHEESYPEFPVGDVPIPVAAAVYQKDTAWVRAGIISGWLPIGRAVRNGQLITDISQMDSKHGRINYYISPKKLWEDTGYVWKGEKSL